MSKDFIHNITALCTIYYSIYYCISMIINGIIIHH